MEILKRNYPRYRCFFILSALLILLLAGCASPSRRIDEMATGWGLANQKLQGDGFELLVYRNRNTRPDKVLHVYLEGDGTPWITRSRVAEDPTSRNPLALRLMALDPAPALYLTRPCYNDSAQAHSCNPWLWTSGRYSETVVASMASALRNLIEAEAVKGIVLIGYSGGGVLAWLLAQRVPEVRTLVTIAANLDIDRWTDRHGYSRLTSSLNPAAGPTMRQGIEQWHLVGNTDTNVPPEIIGALSKQLGPEARVLRLPSDHHCCWLRLWPQILRQLD